MKSREILKAHSKKTVLEIPAFFNDKSKVIAYRLFGRYENTERGREEWLYPSNEISLKKKNEIDKICTNSLSWEESDFSDYYEHTFGKRPNRNTCFIIKDYEVIHEVT